MTRTRCWCADDEPAMVVATRTARASILRAARRCRRACHTDRFVCMPTGTWAQAAAWSSKREVVQASPDPAGLRGARRPRWGQRRAVGRRTNRRPRRRRTRRLIDLETSGPYVGATTTVEAGREGQDHRDDDDARDRTRRCCIVRRDTDGAPGVSGGSREGLGDRDAHARGSGATGSEAEEEDLEQRPTNAHDPDAKVTKLMAAASGAQSRACRRMGPARLSGDTARCRCRDTTTRSRPPSPRPSSSKTRRPTRSAVSGRDRRDKGYHSNQTLIDLDAVGIRSYVSEPDLDVIGRRIPRPGRRCMASVAGCDDAAAA